MVISRRELLKQQQFLNDEYIISTPFRCIVLCNLWLREFLLVIPLFCPKNLEGVQVLTWVALVLGIFRPRFIKTRYGNLL